MFKLTYRDKIIAAIILAIAILMLGFFALAKPKYNEKKDNEAKLVEVQATKAAIEAEIAEIPGLQEDIKTTYKRTNDITKTFVPVEDVKDTVVIDKYMQELAEKNKIKIQSLNLANANFSEVQYYFKDVADSFAEARVGADLNGKIQSEVNAERAETNALSSRAKGKVLQTDYSMTVKGTKKAIWNYLEDIKNFDKTINVKSVTLTDYTFGKDAAKAAGMDWSDDDSDEENTVEVGGNKISNATTAQFVITLYSVYEMDQPNVD